jgi:hypothetical protein
MLSTENYGSSSKEKTAEPPTGEPEAELVDVGGAKQDPLRASLLGSAVKEDSGMEGSGMSLVHLAAKLAVLLVVIGIPAGALTWQEPLRTGDGPTPDLTIDFDRNPKGLPIGSGTELATVYASWGVTFEHGGGGIGCGTSIYANSNHPGDFGSLPNVVTTCDDGTASDISEDYLGLIRANFAVTAVQVCIEVRPDGSSHRAVLRAFDHEGTQIGEVYSTFGVTQSLCVALSGIRSVEFSGSGATYARFDDLNVDFEPGLDPVFLDGFESGDTSAWSSSVP